MRVSTKRRSPSGVLGRCALLAVLLCTLDPAGPADAADELPAVHIGIVADGRSIEGQNLIDRTVREIEILLAGEFEPYFETRYGDWTLDGVQKEIRALEESPEVDLVLALGVLASHLFCCEPAPPKPVIAPLVVDAELQGLPRRVVDGVRTSGRPNLHYLAIPDSSLRDLRTLHEIVPFDRVTFVLDRWLFDAIPDLQPRVDLVAAGTGWQIDAVTVGASIDEAIADLRETAGRDGNRRAVYLAPLLHLPLEDRQRLIDTFVELGLPSFSVFGSGAVERGVLAAHRSDAFFERLARRIALDSQSILLGTDPGTLPTDFADRPSLRINMRTARGIGVDPSWETRTEARLLFEKDLDAPVVTLLDALDDALVRGLDVAVERSAFAVGETQVRSARAALLPSLEATATGVQIDDDRASELSGQAERQVRAGVGLTQVLWSEKAVAHLEIQRSLQEGRRQSLRAAELDAVREAALAYFGLLRAQTLETIRREDLSLTRSHLDLATVRNDLGQAGPSEVYRWQSQVAEARRALVDATSQVQKARYALNRARHRPLDEALRLEAETLTIEYLLERRGRLLAFTGSPRHFDRTTDFMVGEGLDEAPELQELDRAIEAQERVVRSARRADYSPTVVLDVDWSERLRAGGAGSGEDGSSLPFPITIPDDTSWSAAVALSLPLFTGGARRAARTEADLELDRLRVEHDRLAERLEQAIRSNLQDTQAAFSGIVLTRDAAAAAVRGRELVSDAYRQGASDLLDLLDAQNAALAANLAAADAQFDFFARLVEVERSVGYYFDFLSPEEQDAWYERLSEHFRRAGIEPRPDRTIRLGGGRTFVPGRDARSPHAENRP